MTQPTNTTSGAADDSLLLCASDLQHSALYDNHVEMQACICAVANRIAALASAAAPAEQPGEIQNLRKALQFYADKDHFNISDEGAWDTVSGEPQNYWCDEAGTATVEDGSIARLALEGRPIRFEEDDSALPPAPSSEGESNG